MQMAYLSQFAARKPSHSRIITLTVFDRQYFPVVIQSVYKSGSIYISYKKKHLIPFKILSIGGNTLVQSFFPLCEASLELLKLDVV